MKSKFEIERNHCNCHPDTCCCDDWNLVYDGEVLARHFCKEKLEKLITVAEPALRRIGDGPLTPAQRIDRLFDKSEFPTWEEIFDVICDAEFDALNFRAIVADRHGCT